MSMTPNPELTSTGLITDADVAPDAAIQGTKLQYLQNGSGAVARSIQDRLRDVVSVFDFMTSAQVSDVRAGTAAVDVSGAIQAAINATTGEIFFPAGTYRLNSTISWTKSYVGLRGCGDGRTTLKAAFASGDIIVCGDGSAAPANCSVRDMTIDASVTRTSGAAIRVRNGHSFTIENVQLATNQFWGFQFDGGAQQFNYVLRRFEINSGQYGVLVGADGTLVQDVFIENGIVASQTAAGVLIANANGFIINDLDIIASNTGVLLQPGSGKIANSGWISRVLADTSVSNGYMLNPSGTGAIKDVTFTDCWSASSGTGPNDGNGFRIDPSSGSINGIAINTPRIINNQQCGIDIYGGTKISINNPQIFGNSQREANKYSGILVRAGVSNWSVIGGAIGLGGGVPTNQMKYGIQVDPGASDNYRIIGTDCSGNAGGAISDSGTGTSKNIVGVTGARTVNSGLATLASGTTSVVVNHGLGFTPADGDIMAIPAVDIGVGGIARYWVGSITGSTFAITVNAPTTANLFFSWSARTHGA